jgi:hypothetical protein
MHTVDLVVIAVYLAGITWFGARFRSSQRSLKDYFLGGKQAPWWAIGFSIVSAETSTLTIVGTPALSFGGNMGFLQVVLGYLAARIVIVTLLLPHYFRGELFTAYELMRRRFGERVRRVAAFVVLVLASRGGRGRYPSASPGRPRRNSIDPADCRSPCSILEAHNAVIDDVVQMALYVAYALLSFWIL